MLAALIIVKVPAIQAQGDVRAKSRAGAPGAAGARKESKPRATPEQRAEARTRWLTKLVNLTTDQQTKVKEINLSAATKQDENLKQAPGKERGQMRKQINQEREAQITGVLTDTQKTAWANYKAEMKRIAEERKAARKDANVKAKDARKKAAAGAKAATAGEAEPDPDPDSDENNED